MQRADRRPSTSAGNDVTPRRTRPAPNDRPQNGSTP